MKIAFLHSSNDVYGASRVLAADVFSLVGEGHDVTVVVPADGPLRVMREVIGDGYVVDPSMAVIRRSNPRDAARMPRLPLVAQLADVVVLWTLPLALYAPMLRLRQQAHVVSIHERDDGKAGRALRALALGRRTPTQVNSKWVGEWVRHRVDSGHIVCSYPSVDWSAKRSKVESSPIDGEPHFSAGRPMQLLLVGRVNGRKGHVLAVQVVEELFKRGRHVHLTLAGAPYPGQESHLKDLLAMVEQHGKYVSFLGEVPSLQSVASGMDLLLMLPTQPEPFGLTPIEAWQCGLPVIGFPAGGAAESLALVDGMTTRGGVQDIADDLGLLYNDPVGAWRNPLDSVPGRMLDIESGRIVGWNRLLELAVGNA